MTKIDELKAAFEAAAETNVDFHFHIEGPCDADDEFLLMDFWERSMFLMPQLLEAVEVLKQIKVLLDDHPQAAVGNTKVHVVVCKATGALNAFKEDFA